VKALSFLSLPLSTKTHNTDNPLVYKPTFATMLRLARRCLRPRVSPFAAASSPHLAMWQHQRRRGLAQWSVETEHHHKYEDPVKIIDEALINRLLEETREKVWHWGLA
jgi:hypothetical protein